MKRFILPKWIQKHDDSSIEIDHVTSRKLNEINEGIKKLASQGEKPEVSIVIPAYNEEKTLLKTLSSLSALKSRRSIEILVVNNNSSDRTEEILNVCAVRSFYEPRQGISYARQHGLEKARGKFILSADADTIYPPEWVDCMVEPLEDSQVACVYGRYSFIPGEDSSRLLLGLHEMSAELIFNLRKNGRECINVMGFNSGFRREDALKVGGYNHNLQRHITGRSEDGWMAYTLMSLGKIQLVKNNGARVWTSDRRLVYDGGITQAYFKRFKKEMNRIGDYLLIKKLKT